MANPVSCGVNDSKSTLSYEITASALNGLGSKNFSFVIQPTEGGQDVGVFSAIGTDGRLLRQNISKPFPQTALTKKGEKKTSATFNVTLKKHKPVNLNDYF